MKRPRRDDAVIKYSQAIVSAPELPVGVEVMPASGAITENAALPRRSRFWKRYRYREHRMIPLSLLLLPERRSCFYVARQTRK